MQAEKADLPEEDEWERLMQEPPMQVEPEEFFQEALSAAGAARTALLGFLPEENHGRRREPSRERTAHA